MSASLPYSTLVRLLTLNNQVHDLENRMMGVELQQVRVRPDVPEAPEAPEAPEFSGRATGANRIAEIQEEIDRGVRASLTACWLGLPGDPEA